MEHSAGGFPTHGCTADIRQTTQAEGVRKLGLSHVGGSYDGIWVRRNVYLNLWALESSHSIHRNATYSGPLPGGGEEARIIGSQEVVVAGGADIHGPIGGERVVR